MPDSSTDGGPALPQLGGHEAVLSPGNGNQGYPRDGQNAAHTFLPAKLRIRAFPPIQQWAAGVGPGSIVELPRAGVGMSVRCYLQDAGGFVPAKWASPRLKQARITGSSRGTKHAAERAFSLKSRVLASTPR